MGVEFVVDRIMAVADEGYGPDGRRKRRGAGGEKKTQRAGGGGEGRDSLDKLGTGSAARKGRGRRDDKGKKCGHQEGDVARQERKRDGEGRDPSARKRRGPQDDNVSCDNPKVEGELGARFPPKRVGELGELAFLSKAIRMGFLVSKPWGDSDRYDFVSDWKGRLLRVQVRATEHLQGARGWAVHASVYVGKKIVGLTKKDIDVLVAYIFPKDLWYVVPVEKFVPRKNLWFYPDGSKKGAMFEKFREAWEWMQEGKRPGRTRGRRSAVGKNSNGAEKLKAPSLGRKKRRR